MYRLLEKLSSIAMRHPVTCIAIWLILTVIAASAMPRLNVDASYRSFFNDGDPLVTSLDDIQSHYSSGDSLILLIKNHHGDLFNTTGLAAIEEVTTAAWQLPNSMRVDSLSNFPYSRSIGDDLHVEELVSNAHKLSPAEIARIRNDVLNEPLIVDRLITPDGHASLVVITFNDETGNSLKVNLDIYEAARALRDEMQARFPDLGFYVTGVVAGNAAFTKAATADGSVLIPLALLFALLAMLGYLWYESGRLKTAGKSLLSAFAVINAAVLIPMGLMSWFGISANNVTSIIPVVILTLAVADSLHILVTYFQRLQQGDSSVDALRESLRLNAEAVWLTSATTMMGFMTLNFSESPPFQQMGNLVAVGVFTAWLAAITLLPAVMTLLPADVSKNTRVRHDPMPGLAHWVIRHHRLILVSGLISLVAGAACIPMNRLNDSWSTYLSKRNEFRRDTMELMDSFDDINEIEFDIYTGEDSGIYEIEYLEKLSAFASWLREQPEVRFVQSIDMTLMRLNRNMHGDDPAYYRMPETKAEAAQYLLLYEMSLPYGASLNNEVRMNKSGTRLLVGLRNGDTAYHLDMQDRIQKWLKQNAPELYHPGTSTPTIMANLARRDAIGMLWGTAIALLAITLTITLVFRSIGYGLLSLLVNAMPATIALGLWGLFMGQVGLSVSMVFAASLGIVVDYCVHFISKYRRAKLEKNFSYEQAIEYAFSTVGIALLVTTAVLCINFGILGFSEFRLNVYLGVLTAITIVLALLSQLFFLPSLLMTAARFREKRQKSQKVKNLTRPAEIVISQ